jgi:2,5-dihydroxypyridine 5,6-dioxygenase
MQAADKIGLEGQHIIPYPHSKGIRYIGNKGIADWMWELLGTADIIISTGIAGRDQYPGAIPHYCQQFNDMIVEDGVRELDIGLSPQEQRRLFPTEERKRRGYAGAEAIANAKEMIFKSAAGTNLVCDKRGRPGHAQVSMVNKNHRWDNFGYDTSECCPLEDGVNGTLVLEPGDLITSLPSPQWVTDPVTLTWEDGYVTKIEGGYTAKRFKRHMNRVTNNGEDREGYGSCHFGWGIIHEASPLTGSRKDLGAYHHSAAGSVMVALGQSYGFMQKNIEYCGLAGERHARSHTHMTLFNLDVYLDDEKVVKKGKIIKEGF